MGSGEVRGMVSGEEEGCGPVVVGVGISTVGRDSGAGDVADVLGGGIDLLAVVFGVRFIGHFGGMFS